MSHTNCCKVTTQFWKIFCCGRLAQWLHSHNVDGLFLGGSVLTEIQFFLPLGGVSLSLDRLRSRELCSSSMSPLLSLFSYLSCECPLFSSRPLPCLSSPGLPLSVILSSGTFLSLNLSSELSLSLPILSPLPSDLSLLIFLSFE